MTSELSPREVLALCRQREIKAIDLRFVDFRGYQRHFTIPADQLTEESFEDGFGFDGSSMRGWQAIHESDMLVVPDSKSAFVDPFMKHTMALLGNVKDPVTHQSYPRDPRNIARKAENYMQSTGIADQAMFGSEVEFFVFDSVTFDQNEHEAFYHLQSCDGHWSRGTERGNGTGYQIRRRDGYLAMPPMDTLQELRTDIMLALEEAGISVQGQHREVASGGHCEVDLNHVLLLQASDRLVRLKYLVRNFAARHGKVATFMPKPLWNDNGSGLHLHLSLWKDGDPLFAGSGYGGLSETAMFAMGGILRHAPSLLAFCCPTTNSYKRLIPGFEAPVNLSYSYRNRSAAIRIPVNAGNESHRRLEFRCPDSSCNPYLATSAILMAALDGIENRIDPGRPLDKDLYDLEPEEQQNVASTPSSLDAALTALKANHDFLLRGDVFTPDVVERWISFKRSEEVAAIDQRPHPYEFAMYFDC
ncbi:MAG: type I glutamate--ammonia ligase [Fuerstiella sp.]|nr:type I glutamate--ammonia ligase [Fuerstiella sp.]MCP4856293.1 type I glutamate--ammonia ligase [Fuerstiella sp.]